RPRGAPGRGPRGVAGVGADTPGGPGGLPDRHVELAVAVAGIQGRLVRAGEDHSHLGRVSALLRARIRRRPHAEGARGTRRAVGAGSPERPAHLPDDAEPKAAAAAAAAVRTVDPDCAGGAA